MNPICFNPIGIVRTPFKERTGIPRQAAGAQEIAATIELNPVYETGLTDLEGFSHIVVVFYLHLINHFDLMANPPWDDKPHGVFSTCSPFRPNPIGISVVQLEKIEGCIVHIRGVDMADYSPVLDLKPYIPTLYPQNHIRAGWLEGKMDGMIKSKSGDH